MRGEPIVLGPLQVMALDQMKGQPMPVMDETTLPKHIVDELAAYMTANEVQTLTINHIGDRNQLKVQENRFYVVNLQK